jgi:hypothetical protein
LTTKRSTNGSTRLSFVSPSLSASAPDPLDRARERLARATEATNLLEYTDDFDEPTGRTDVHVHMPSKPDSDPPPKVEQAVWLIKAVRSWPQALFGLGLIALLAFIAWLKFGR